MLVKPNDPYISQTGELIEAERSDETSDFLTVDERRKILPKFTRIGVVKTTTLDDLPEPNHQKQAVISAVVTMRLLGMSTINIATVLGSELDYVNSIINLPATQTTFETLFKNLININSDTLQGRISSYAMSSIDTIVELRDDKEERGDVRLKAAQDLLDRSGANAEQFFAEQTRQTQNDDELRIVIMNEDNSKEKVSIEFGRKTK